MCVSIEQERVYLINPTTQEVKTFKTQGQVGFAAFDGNEHIIYAAYKGVYRINIKTGEEQYLFHCITDPTIRYNDGKFDPYGNILLGTTGYKCFREAANGLYCWNGRECKQIISGTSISNGLDWYEDYMFFIDSPTRRIGRYHYEKFGNATFDRYIVEIDGAGVPDGMCIDSEGNIYVAIWGGSRVEKYNQQGEKLGEISIPVLNVSSVCIAGDKLYITTAMHDDGTESELAAGGLFVASKF